MSKRINEAVRNQEAVEIAELFLGFECACIEDRLGAVLARVELGRTRNPRQRSLPTIKKRTNDRYYAVKILLDIRALPVVGTIGSDNRLGDHVWLVFSVAALAPQPREQIV